MIEDKIVIAKFMGGVMCTDDPRCVQISFMRVDGAVAPDKTKFAVSTRLKYDTSWKWLMPVVERINAIPNTAVNITNGYSQVYHRGDSFGLNHSDDMKEHIYQAALAFIIWYGLQESN